MSFRIIALATACFLARCSADNYSSFNRGAVYSGSYNGRNVSTEQWPNAGFVAEVKHCQQTCRTTAHWCEAFTYMPGSGKMWGPGACWLFGPGAVLATSDTPKDFVSGLKYAPGEEPQTTIAPTTNEPTIATVPTVPPVNIATLAPLTTAVPTGNATVAGETSGGGGFPLWGWLLGGALGVALVGLLAYFLFCGKDEAPKKKKKKTSKRSVALVGENGTAREVQAFTAAPEVKAVAAPVAQYVLAPNAMPQYATAPAVQMQGGSTMLSRQYARVDYA